ncbi:MAG: hypothetical protein EOP35_17115, partial [Rubrivivax sp.]
MSRGAGVALLGMSLSLAQAQPQPARAKPAAARTPAAAKAPAAVVGLPERVRELGGIEEYRLPNGLQVLLFPDATQTTTTVNITY